MHRRRPRPSYVDHRAVRSARDSPVELTSLPEHRARLDGRALHAGQADIDRVDEAAVELGAVSSRFTGLPAIFQSFGSLALRLWVGGVCWVAAAQLAATRGAPTPCVMMP
jgi:hypothetical protein